MNPKNKIGLYFGSFNPMHFGHLLVVNEAIRTGIDKLFIVVSPQSPFKPITELAPYEDRIKMASITLHSNNLQDKAEVVEWEKLNYPSFTIDTLNNNVKGHFDDCEIVIFMGLDNFLTIEGWKDASEIVDNYQLHIIPRDIKNVGEVLNNQIKHLRDLGFKPKQVTYSKIPEIMELSATQIRNHIKNGQKIPNGLIDPEVEKYITTNKLYI